MRERFVRTMSLAQFDELKISDDTREQLEEKENKANEVEDGGRVVQDPVDQEVDKENEKVEAVEPISTAQVPTDESVNDQDIGFDNRVENVSEDYTEVVNFPEYDATTSTQQADINGTVYEVLPAQENKPVFLVLSGIQVRRV